MHSMHSRSLPCTCLYGRFFTKTGIKRFREHISAKRRASDMTRKNYKRVIAPLLAVFLAGNLPLAVYAEQTEMKNTQMENASCGCTAANETKRTHLFLACKPYELGSVFTRGRRNSFGFGIPCVAALCLCRCSLRNLINGNACKYSDVQTGYNSIWSTALRAIVASLRHSASHILPVLEIEVPYTSQ